MIAPLSRLESIRQMFGESFAPLRTRALRLYLGGQAISLIGSWMQVTAQSWVVWQLTGSGQALGIVGMLSMIPFFFLGPWAGVWADRFDRRRLLITLQAASMVLALVLALLVQTDQVKLEHVYILALLLGIVGALDIPAQQAFIGDISGMDQVRRAVVINVIILQISRMLGPAMAGLLINSLGVATAFWINGLSFLAVIGSLLAIRTNQVLTENHGNILGQFREGMSFVRNQPRMIDLIMFTLLIATFVLSNLQLMPAFADDVLHGGADTLGLLMGSSGAGALLGALVVVPFVNRLGNTGLALAGGTVWAGLWFCLFSLSTWLPASIVCLMLASMSVPVVMTTTTGLMQLMAPPAMRARIMSLLLMVSFGIQPLAALLVGSSADFIGAPLTVRISGLLAIAGALLMLVFRPELRGWHAAR